MVYIYANQIHNIVINILNSIDELNFKSLYRKVTKIFQENKIATIDRKGKGRKIKDSTRFQLSLSPFSNTLQKMVNDGYLNVRIDKSSGRTIPNKYYSLTEKARKALQIQVLQKSDNQKEFKKIYKKIIFNEFLQEETILYSDQEFEEFLGKLNVKKEDLEWGAVGYSSIPQISVILYPDAPFNHRVSRKQQDIVNQELWRDPNMQTREITAEFICFPLKGDLDFEVKKVEHWQMNKNKKNKLLKIEYRFFKPGISREELVRDEDSEKIDEAIKILQKYNLIQPTIFAQEIRYIISDIDLKDLVWIITKILKTFYNIFLIKITYFDGPDERENNIMNEYLGQKKFRRIRVEKELKRYQHRYQMKRCNNLLEYLTLWIDNNIANGTNLSVTTYVKDFLREKGYLPKYREKNTSIEDSRSYNKKLLEQLLLKSNPKSEVKKLIEEYYNYIKEKIYKQLEWLPVNFEGEGLEEIKMDYENVIKEYSFLKEIIDPVFPMIFEPSNIELQKDIFYHKALGAYFDEKRKKSWNELYEIENIGSLEYEYEEISNNEEREDDRKRYSPIPGMEIIPIKKQKIKVPYRILRIRDLDTGERKEIKIYRDFTVQPF